MGAESELSRWPRPLTSGIKSCPFAAYPQTSKALKGRHVVVQVDHGSGLLGYSRGECRPDDRAARSGRRSRRRPEAQGQRPPRGGGDTPEPADPSHGAARPSRDPRPRRPIPFGFWDRLAPERAEDSKTLRSISGGAGGGGRS